MIFVTTVKLQEKPEHGKFTKFVTSHRDRESGASYYPKFFVSEGVELPEEIDLNETYEILCSVTYDREITTHKDSGRGQLFLKKIRKFEKEQTYVDGYGHIKAKFKSGKTGKITNEDNTEFTVNRLTVEDEIAHTHLGIYGDVKGDLKEGEGYRFGCLLFNKRHLINGYPSELPEHQYKGKPIYYTELHAQFYVPHKEIKNKVKDDNYYKL